MKVGGARGQVGVAKLSPKFSWLEVGLHAKFRPSRPSSYWDTACFVFIFYYFFAGRGQKKAPSSKALWDIKSKPSLFYSADKFGFR